MSSAHQRRDEVNAGYVINVVWFEFTLDTFLAARFDTRLEDVRVEKMLHGLGAQVDTQVFQLTRLDRSIEYTHIQRERERNKGWGRK